jgi:hypothetical protein
MRLNVKMNDVVVLAFTVSIYLRTFVQQMLLYTYTYTG